MTTSEAKCGGRAAGRAGHYKTRRVLRFARGHYHLLLSAHGLGTQRFSTQCARLAAELFFTCGHYHSLLGAHGFSKECPRVARALRFACGHYHSSGAPGFSAERATLAWCTSLRSWFQKKCLLPIGILIFFLQNTPDFEI